MDVIFPVGLNAFTNFIHTDCPRTRPWEAIYCKPYAVASLRKVPCTSIIKRTLKKLTSTLEEHSSTVHYILFYWEALKHNPPIHPFPNNLLPISLTTYAFNNTHFKIAKFCARLYIANNAIVTYVFFTFKLNMKRRTKVQQNFYLIVSLC